MINNKNKTQIKLTSSKASSKYELIPSKLN